MIVRNISNVIEMGHMVECPNGGFVSNRYITKQDNMGFGMTRTMIPPNGVQNWHYKNHMEACICVRGVGILTEINSGVQHEIKPGTMYALDKNDNHLFEALEEVELICVFNPPLVGNEVHQTDGSYAVGVE